MQATITYLLTEQAQRAQMMATGQPVARKQISTVEIATADLDMLDMTDCGQPELDLSQGYATAMPQSKRIRAILLGANYSTPASPAELDVAAGTTGLDAVRAAIAAKYAADAAKKEEVRQARLKELAQRSAKMDEQLALITADPSASISLLDPGISGEEGALHNHPLFPAIEARRQARRQRCVDLAQTFLSDATARAVAIDGERPHWVDIRDSAGATVRVHYELVGHEIVNDLAKEARGREKLDGAGKVAKEAAREKAKVEFLREWIAEHGSASQMARSADNLLCRDEAIGTLADSTFRTLGSVVTVYTSDSRPAPNCTCEECDNYEPCGTTHDATDSAACLSDQEYHAYSRIKQLMPGATYVLRTHSAIHDCDHQGGCARGENHACMVTVAVGPFKLQREYAL